MSDAGLSAQERETVLACDCGHDIHEHNHFGCYASDYYPDRQVRCTCTETDDRPPVNFAAVERILAARLADRDAAGVEARVRALAGDLDEEVAERRANTQTIGPDDRQAFMHYTAGLSEAADRLRAALSGPADAHPADGTGA